MKQTVYITRYATTKGIIKTECEIKNSDYPRLRPYVQYRNHTTCDINKDAFTNLSVARHDAQTRIKKKIASLKKQVTRLEGMLANDDLMIIEEQ